MDTSAATDIIDKYYLLDKPENTKPSDLEFKLLFTISFHLSFKEAKKQFVKSYLSNLLVLTLGNVSKAADLAHLNRRHIHRICSTLLIDTENYRRDMVKPDYYLKENIQGLLEETVADHVDREKKEYFTGRMEDLSSVIAEHIESPLSYEEAIGLFEKEFLRHTLQSNGWNIKSAAKSIKISERTLYRKLEKLGINFETQP